MEPCQGRLRLISVAWQKSSLQVENSLPSTWEPKPEGICLEKEVRRDFLVQQADKLALGQKVP